MYLQVLPQNQYSHECNFVFFYSGLFKIHVQCSGYDSNSLGVNVDEANTKSDHSISYHKQQQQLRAEMMSNKSGAINITLNQPNDGPCLWNCAPLIEITVSDS